MTALVDRWDKVADASSALDQLARQVDDEWGERTAAHASDVQSVQRAIAALPRLRNATNARITALDALDASARQAREAVVRIAQADAKSLGAVMRDSEATLKSRRRSEAAFEELGRDLAGSGLEGFRAAVDAQRDLAATRKQIAEMQREFDALIAGQKRLLDLLASARMAQQRARAAGWLSGGEEPAIPRVQAVPGLAGATPTALKASPAPRLRAVSAESADAHNRELGDRAAELDRLEDAVTYLELVDGPKNASMASEHATLIKQRTKADAALKDARSRLAKDVTETEARVTELSGAIRSQQQAIDVLQNLVAPASEEARRISKDVAAQVDSLLPAVRSAEESAIAEWEDAYIAVHGVPPPVAVTTPAHAPVQQQQDRPRQASTAPLVLGGHAFDFIDTWNEEREGYGAYTYVLLRSADDLRSPAVRSRYERLLDVVQRQTDARDVPRSAARSLNLFCIPVQASRERSKPDLSYGSALGCQIKLRMQSGLFTRPELRARLTGSPGPFLLTLPLRIDAADASSPLLFADLATYPEPAIRDLASAYMGTLLREFPRQQTLWTPPTPQKVALSMIWFASETSALLQTLIPAAQASPRKS